MGALDKTSVSQTSQITINPHLSGLATLYSLEPEVSFVKWDTPNLTFKFNRNVASPDHETGFVWNQNYSKAVIDIFANLSDVTALTFEEVSEDADINFWYYHEEDNVYGYSYGVDGLGVFLNARNLTNSEIPIFGYDYLTIAHEIIHNLGLTHPFDGYRRFPGVLEPGDSGDLAANQNIYTATSYNDTNTLSDHGVRVNPTTKSSDVTYGLSSLGVIDQALLQILYNSNEFYNQNDTIYSMDDSKLNSPWITIWDTGGIDTIELASNSTKDAYIDLSKADFKSETESKLGGLSTFFGPDVLGGFVIGANVIIEKARSGTGNDTIIGNEYSNHIYSSGGNNIVRPGLGNNLIELGSGDDIIQLTPHGEWTALYSAVHVNKINQNSTNEKINLDGFKKYTDLIFAGEGVNEVHLSNQNDAFFWDDQFSTFFKTSNDTTIARTEHGPYITRATGIKKIVAGDGDDILDFTTNIMNSFDIQLFGQIGNDVLWGGDGNDILRGGDGNDKINGGPGDDLLDGGPGENTFSFSGAFGNDTIENWKSGTNTLKFFNLSDAVPNVMENVISFKGFGSITLDGVSSETLDQVSIEIV